MSNLDLFKKTSYVRFNHQFKRTSFQPFLKLKPDDFKVNEKKGSIFDRLIINEPEHHLGLGDGELYKIK